MSYMLIIGRCRGDCFTFCKQCRKDIYALYTAAAMTTQVLYSMFVKKRSRKLCKGETRFISEALSTT